MTITFADVGYTLAAPAFAALLVAWLIAQILPVDVAVRWWLPAGAAAGFVVGYVLLPEWAPLWPDRHWLWLPSLAVVATILGAVSAGESIRPWERWLAASALALIAALTIVPTWDNLQPPRTVLLPLVAAYLFSLYALIAALPRGLRGRTLTGLLALSAFGTAVFVAYEVSAKLGQLGATLAAALIGVAASAVLFRGPVETDSAAGNGPTTHSISNRGLALLYAVAVGGLAFVAAVEPTAPAWPLLLAPAAPLTLWLFATLPLARLSGITAVAVKTIAVMVILAATAAWLLLRAEPPTDDWSAKDPPPAPLAGFKAVNTVPILGCTCNRASACNLSASPGANW